ncbi:MAG: C25 family cysteine peptidase [Acidobacteriota bacterium]|nr:C25 family cysteine peptidase [Acidobacteriota bacterium]
MSLLATLTQLFDKDREHLFADWIKPSHVDKQLNPQPIQAGRHYLRLWLSEMFLNKEVQGAKSWYPAVHSLASFDFGNQPVEIPNIADTTRIGAQPNRMGDVIARNFQLTPPMPFNGGTVTLQAGLIALEGQNYLKTFLDVLGKFSGLLNVAQLSTVLGIAQPLALGVQQLLGSTDGHMHLGFRDSFTAETARDGYIAAIRGTENEVRPSELRVVNNQLRIGTGFGESQHRPLEGFDYMLFRVEVFEERDDWEKLTSIQEPFQEALRDLLDPLTSERAVYHLRTAMLRARLAPELTTADRRRVVDSLQEQFDQAKNSYRSNLVDGGPLSLAYAMSYASDAETALQDGEPSIAEIFSKTASALPAMKTMSAPPDKPQGSGIQSGATPPSAGLDPAKGSRLNPSPQPERGFFFDLEGENVEQGGAVCNTSFNLLFDYNVPSPDVLAILKGKTLNKAREEDAELTISVIPKGFTFTDGRWTKPCKFTGGKLAAPVRFHLKADREPLEDSGLHICFERNRSILYEFHIPLKLVKTAQELQDLPPSEPLALELDELLEAGNREKRAVTLGIYSKGGRLSVLYENSDTDDYIPLELDSLTQTTLAASLAKIKPTLEKVANHAVWGLIEDPFNPPADEGVRKGLRKCMRLVATAGATLYSELCTDKDFADVLKRIDEDLQPGSLLSIRTDCAYLPWEILYPGKFQDGWEDGSEPQIQKLWGSRFSIECLQMGWNKRYKTPTRLHESSRPHLNLSLNTTIDEAFAGKSFLPVASHTAFEKEIRAKGFNVEVFDDGPEIKQMLRSENNNATLIYLYCHGQNDRPLVEDHVETLELDHVHSIQPTFLDDEIKYNRGPIIFLNSCSSAAFSPLSFGTFLSRFRDKQALGLIGTSFTIPAAFGAIFAQRLIRRYFDGEPLGEALFDIRRELLKLDVPLGLFYSLQCPADIKAGK